MHVKLHEFVGMLAFFFLLFDLHFFEYIYILRCNTLFYKDLSHLR